jgi:hypothetical protein
VDIFLRFLTRIKFSKQKELKKLRSSRYLVNLELKKRLEIIETDKLILKQIVNLDRHKWNLNQEIQIYRFQNKLYRRKKLNRLIYLYKGTQKKYYTTARFPVYRILKDAFGFY